MKYKSLILITASLVLATWTSSAQVIAIEDTATGSFDTWTGSSSASFSFSGLDLTGGDKLVVTIGGGEGTSSATPWTSVTFNGVAMTEAARQGEGAGGSAYQSGIYYLDDLSGVSATDDLTVSADTLNNRGISATAWVLSGTAAGHGATGTSDGASTSLTTTAANSWVLAHSTYSGTTAPTAQSPLTAEHSIVHQYNSAPQNSIATGYQTIVSTGTSLTPTFNNGDTTVAAEFTAVPEPGSFALLAGFLGLTWVMLRRR